jgi:hypothetical protein
MIITFINSGERMKIYRCIQCGKVFFFMADISRHKEITGHDKFDIDPGDTVSIDN